MEIHYKATIWSRILLDDTKISKEEVIRRLDAGESYADIATDAEGEFDILYDTESPLTVKDNGGDPTVELMEYQDGKLGLQSIWNNGENEYRNWMNWVKYTMSIKEEEDLLEFKKYFQHKLNYSENLEEFKNFLKSKEYKTNL